MGREAKIQDYAKESNHLIMEFYSEREISQRERGLNLFVGESKQEGSQASEMGVAWLLC